LLPIFLSIITGYLFGSIPTAYILVHWKHRSDIRIQGSGNVGALNTWESTGSKSLASAVLIIDLLKGLCAVFVTYQWIDSSFWMLGLAGMSSVLGHNYSVWIGFEGGRGLATAAGVLLPLSWGLPVLWCVLWIASKKVFGDIHVANAVALVLAPVIVWIWPTPWESTLLSIGTGSRTVAPMFTSLCIIVLTRHVEPLFQSWHSSHQSTSHDV